MAHIHINSLKVEGTKRISCNFKTSSNISSYFLEKNFFAEYNTSIHLLPKSILIIPFLANILPIAWALNADVEVDEIDRTFQESVIQVKKAMAAMYPGINFGGSLSAKKIVHNRSHTEKIGILFSGGVDSLNSYVTHWLNKPDLITVWGADINLNQPDAWELVKNNIEDFGDKYDLKNIFIKSNLRAFINEPKLNAKFNKEIANWWGGIQHGFALLGLTAPLGYSKVYIPSTHTEDFSYPWGSAPSIDNSIKWATSMAIHDGYELGRQNKLHKIGDFIRNHDNTLQIRVCYRSKDGNNCCLCEKCNRTMVGLLIEGLKPNNHGFNFSDKNVVFIKNSFEKGLWNIGEDEVFMWKDMQKKAKFLNNPEEPELFLWLATSDFDKYHFIAQKKRSRKLKRLAGHIPAPFRKVLSKIKSFL